MKHTQCVEWTIEESLPHTRDQLERTDSNRAWFEAIELIHRSPNRHI